MIGKYQLLRVTPRQQQLMSAIEQLPERARALFVDYMEARIQAAMDKIFSIELARQSDTGWPP